MRTTSRSDTDPKRRGWRHRPGTPILLGVLVAAVLAIACGAGTTPTSGTGDSGGSAGDGDATATKATADAAAKIGDPVRDGKFEFTVQKMKCGVAKVGSSLLNEKAQGQFCLVTIKVSNIGKEAQTFSDSSQKGFSADGAEYATDSTAGIYANDDNDVLFNEINPGNEVTGVLVFDIPKDAKLVKLELHDSPFSGGVTVDLT